MQIWADAMRARRTNLRHRLRRWAGRG